MFGTHLVLTSADDTGSTTGKATAVAYPTDAFVRVSVYGLHYHNVWGQGTATLPAVRRALPLAVGPTLS